MENNFFGHPKYPPFASWKDDQRSLKCYPTTSEFYKRLTQFQNYDRRFSGSNLRIFQEYAMKVMAQFSHIQNVLDAVYLR